MIYIGANQLLNLNLQIAYAQLYSKYQQLNIEHQNNLVQKQQLAGMVQLLKNQNQEIKSKITQLMAQTHATIIEPSLEQNQQHHLQITINSQKKNKKKVKKLESLETNDPLQYNCTYEGCNRIYRSAVSMNMHIKIKHNGGTKKQRQEYAKMIIDAEQRGEQIPQIPITLPTHFLQQFRTSYAYMKKYCM